MCYLQIEIDKDKERCEVVNTEMLDTCCCLLNQRLLQVIRCAVFGGAYLGAVLNMLLSTASFIAMGCTDSASLSMFFNVFLRYHSTATRSLESFTCTFRKVAILCDEFLE